MYEGLNVAYLLLLTALGFAAPLMANTPNCRWENTSSYDELHASAIFDHKLSGDYYTTEAINTENLSKIEVIEDLRCLKLVFATAYSATAYYKEQGVDLVQRLEQLITKIDEENISYSRQFLLDYLSTIHKGAFDGHSFYFFVNKYAALNGPSSQIGTVKGPKYPTFVYIAERFVQVANQIFYLKKGLPIRIKECDNLDPIKLALPKKQTGFGNITFAGFRETEEMETTVSCKTNQGRNIQFDLTKYQASSDSKPTDEAKLKGAILEELGNGVQYLRVGKFPNPMTIEQEAIATRLLNSDAPLVIDVRGVGGGAGPFNDALESSLFTADQKYKTSSNHKTWSFLTLFGVAQVYESMKVNAQWNPNLTEEERIRRVASLNSTIENWHTASLYYSELYSLTTIADVVTDTFENETQGQRPEEKQSNIIILFDRGCGSQCEFLVSKFRHHPKVRMLGVPTAGRLNFANNGSTFLPNSKITFIPSSSLTSHVPNAQEGEGIWPDRFVLTENAKDIAIRMIKEK
jgi:hypothetical protein